MAYCTYVLCSILRLHTTSGGGGGGHSAFNWCRLPKKHQKTDFQYLEMLHLASICTGTHTQTLKDVQTLFGTNRKYHSTHLAVELYA